MDCLAFTEDTLPLNDAFCLHQVTFPEHSQKSFDKALQTASLPFLNAFGYAFLLVCEVVQDSSLLFTQGRYISNQQQSIAILPSMLFGRGILLLVPIEMGVEQLLCTFFYFLPPFSNAF